jgi:hypothetical protein
MNTTNGTDGAKRSIGSLRDLSHDVAPPRDLWPSIAAQLNEQGATSGHDRSRSRLRPTGMQWAALAAVVSALAVGMWLGRSVLPASGEQASVSVAANGGPATTVNGSANAGANGQPNGSAGPAPAGATPGSGTLGSADPNSQVQAASYVTDPRYTMQRASMVRELEAQLKTLPVETQQKVAASLTTIRGSMKDIQAALGRDPANALLQELLVNTYQDEMRVLTAVHEASDAGEGI